MRSVGGLPRSFIGPEASVSAVTVDSIRIFLWGLRDSRKTRKITNCNSVNWLSSMKLLVENLKSNKKQTT